MNKLEVDSSRLENAYRGKIIHQLHPVFIYRRTPKERGIGVFNDTGKSLMPLPRQTDRQQQLLSKKVKVAHT